MSLEYIKGIQENVDKNETIKLLRTLLADEFVSIQQYLTQEKIIQGIHKENIIKELVQHRNEEVIHADLLMERIIELGGNPELSPADIITQSKCKYQANESWHQKPILDIAIAGERCAVERYGKIALFVKNKDTSTYDLIMKILDEEYEHVVDLSKLRDLVHGVEKNQNKINKGSQR